MSPNGDKLFKKQFECYNLSKYKKAMHNAIAEQAQIIGIHTFRNYDTSTLEAQELEKKIQNHIQERKQWANPANHRAHYLELLQQFQKFMTRELVIRNIVVTTGRSVLAQRLSGTVTYTGTINYGALGSSSTAPTNADTQLGTEVFRKVVASSSSTTNNSFIDFFYSKADTNGTYQEFGTFVDGSAGANTGQMFTHALTGGWTKSSSESMTVSCQYTIN